MSRFWMWGGTMLLAIFMLAAPAQKAYAQPGGSVSFQMFYDALSPHGQWIDDPTHGYVWTPRGVGRDFRPYYSGGRWAMTDYGNTWVSDYPWGWAPFHYGRWAYDPFYGWMWIPGTTWGPAWVSWRGGGEYYGWAPMGPGININISIGPRYAPPADWWVFVPCNRIYSHGGYGRYWRGAGYNNTYINNTTIINNTYINNNNTYVIGPRGDEIQRRTGQRVNVYNVRNDNNPGRSRFSGNSVNLYRPEVRQERNANYRPQNVVRAERGGSRDANAVRSNNTGNADRNRVGQTDAMRAGRGERPVDTRVQNGDVQAQQRGDRNRAVQAQQPRAGNENGMQTRQQRDVQMQQERAVRERDMRAQQQQRQMQMQQEHAGRERDIRAQQQQRNMQMQQERAGRERDMRAQQQQQQIESRRQQERYQAQAADRQREAQQRIQQQRAAEQRAQQQQQIESRRQQRWENQQQPQHRAIDRGGAPQRVESTQSRQAPQNYDRRGGGENRGRR
jgi:hypothetical protein